MAEWLVEDGIAERRAILVKNDRAIAAKLCWPGELNAGEVVRARVTARRSDSHRAVAHTERGQEILLDRVPREASEGSEHDIVVTRGSIAERGRFKQAQGRLRMHSADSVSPWPGKPARVVRRFPPGMWEDIWTAAATGEVAFAGGTLLFAVTPGMTVIDIDGELPARELALAAVPALAHNVRLFDLGGSIGIDFPTLPDKRDRRAVDEALSAALTDWPHERTAMNGFGFVQLVARLDGPSLLHRLAFRESDACARRLLRQAEMLQGAGRIQLTASPAVKAALRGEWLEELRRRAGCSVEVRVDPTIAPEAGHAQMVGHE